MFRFVIFAIAFTFLVRDAFAAEPSADESEHTNVAQRTGITLEWRAPAGCPNADAVLQATARLLGRDLDPGTPAVSAHAVVSRNRGHWQVRLRLASSAGTSEETLIAKHCRAIADAVALKVALLVDPLAVVEAMDQAPRSPTQTETKPTPSRDEPEREKQKTPAPAATKSNLGLSIRPMFGASFGMFPTIVPGAALSAAFEFGVWRIEVGGVGFWGARANYEEPSDVGAHFQLGGLFGRLCAMPSAGDLELPICAGVEGGAMRGEGYGIRVHSSAYSSWIGATIGPAVRVPLRSRIALWVEADAILTIVRPRFRVRYLEELYRAPLASARVWVGIELVLSE